MHSMDTSFPSAFPSTLNPGRIEGGTKHIYVYYCRSRLCTPWSPPSPQYSPAHSTHPGSRDGLNMYITLKESTMYSIVTSFPSALPSTLNPGRNERGTKHIYYTVGIDYALHGHLLPLSTPQQAQPRQDKGRNRTIRTYICTTQLMYLKKQTNTTICCHCPIH